MKRTSDSSRGRSARAAFGTQLLTLQQAADVTGRNPELLRRWCVAGRIACQRMGRDWLIPAVELVAVEGMPHRGGRRRADMDLDDLGVLPASLADAVRECLDAGEQTRVVLAGVEDSALVVTDRKMLMARDGVLVTEPDHGRVAVWPLPWARRVQLTAGTSAGAVVLTPADATDRALVLLLGRPHLARAEAAVTELRRIFLESGNYADAGRD